MKWSFVIRQKVKAAALLCGTIVVIVLSLLNINQALQDMDQSIESVYVDRLQPAVDLVYLSENLHNRRLVMQNCLTGSSSVLIQDAVKLLENINAKSNSLISSFEKTKLTTGEAEKLNYFKGHLKAYAQLENAVLQLEQNNCHYEAILLFERHGGSIFQQGIMTLHAMAKIQSDTGIEAVKSAHRQAAGGLINTSLLIAICVIIGLIILGLLRDERLVNPKSDFFHLN